jgi:hypothetical protein
MPISVIEHFGIKVMKGTETIFQTNNFLKKNRFMIELCWIGRSEPKRKNIKENLYFRLKLDEAVFNSLVVIFFWYFQGKYRKIATYGLVIIDVWKHYTQY